jgi:hypothetical protein
MTPEAAISPPAAVLLVLDGTMLLLMSFLCFCSACSRDSNSATATASSSPLPRNEDAALSAHLACASDNATTSGIFCLLLQHVILPATL